MSKTEIFFCKNYFIQTDYGITIYQWIKKSNVMHDFFSIFYFIKPILLSHTSYTI